MSEEKTSKSYEEQFLTAVRKGEIGAVNHLLDKQKEIDLDINCTDKNGLSALKIACTEGNLALENRTTTSICPLDRTVTRTHNKGGVDICSRTKELWTPAAQATVIAPYNFYSTSNSPFDFAIKLNNSDSNESSLETFSVEVKATFHRFDANDGEKKPWYRSFHRVMNEVVIYPLLEKNVRIGDSLLRAVDCDFVEAVRLFCAHARELPSPEERKAIIDCHCENDDFHPDVTPIVLASQKNNFFMIKMLVEVGARIPELTADTFHTAATDSLQQSVGSLELYKGLASEAYVVHSSDDPINRCFTLCYNLRKISEIEVEFKMPYLELLGRIEQCSQELIGQARNTEEVLTILTTQETALAADGRENDAKLKGPLPKISRAVELEQRKFIASPNCQQAVISQFYRRLIYLRDKSGTHRFLYLVTMILLHPILALLFLFVPKKSVREFVTTPYIKLVLYIGSDLLLVMCLTMEAVLDKGAAYQPTLLQPYKIFVCIWIIGLAWKEVNDMRTKDAKKMIMQWHHIRDIFIIISFLYAVIFDAIAFAVMTDSRIASTDPVSRSTRSIPSRDQQHIPQPPGLTTHSLHLNTAETYTSNPQTLPNISAHRVFIGNYTSRRRVVSRTGVINVDRLTQHSIVDEGDVLNRMWSHPQLVARSLFTISTVVSIARIYPYLVVSDVVGPLKISFGSMVQKTSHFFVVVGLVLLSFAAGLTYIYAYYNKAAHLRCQAKQDGETSCSRGNFRDLLTSLITLYWSIFGLNPLEVLELPENAYMLETAGRLMYAMFYIFVVVVLMNALIAVMSQVYTEVEENADVVWKFSCTAIWIGFMDDNNPLPPPYNLLPSYETLASMCRKTVRPYRWKSDREKLLSSSKQSERELTKTFIQESRKRLDERSKDKRYKKIMALLVDRYVTEKTSGESSTTADVSQSDVRGLKNDLIALRYETFLKMCKTHDCLVRVAEDCLRIHGQSKDTRSIFEKTDEVEKIVHQHALNVQDFHTALNKTIAKLPPPPTPPPSPEPGPPSKIIRLIKYYDNGGIRFEDESSDDFTLPGDDNNEPDAGERSTEPEVDAEPVAEPGAESDAEPVAEPNAKPNAALDVEQDLPTV